MLSKRSAERLSCLCTIRGIDSFQLVFIKAAIVSREPVFRYFKKEVKNVCSPWKGGQAVSTVTHLKAVFIRFQTVCGTSR